MMYGDNSQQFAGNGWNNGFVGMGNPAFATPPQPNQVKQMNVLTQDEIQRLMVKKNEFSLMVSEEDKLRAACNHRRADGLGDALIEEDDGICRCEICGYRFQPVDGNSMTEKDIQDSVNLVTDILQTIKMIYIDLDPTVIREYYQILPMLNKIPELFKLAVQDYARHEKYNPLFANSSRNMNTAQMFAALTGFFNGANNVYQAPQYQQQYAPNQGYFGFQQAPYQGPSNGFGYVGASAYQPQTAGFQYNPNQQAQWAAPQQPVNQPAPAPAPEASKAEPEANVAAPFKAGN